MIYSYSLTKEAPTRHEVFEAKSSNVLLHVSQITISMFPKYNSEQLPLIDEGAAWAHRTKWTTSSTLKPNGERFKLGDYI
jgi:hypothetical protein